MLRKAAMASPETIVLSDVGAGRDSQEDRCTIISPDQFPAQTDEKLAFFAVYDGHGSEWVAEHASQNLHGLVVKRSEFEQGDYARAIKGALSDEDNMLYKSFKFEAEEPAFAGSTAAICLINLTHGELIVANLGDSHVILAERDPATDRPFHIRRLTEAHKPELPGERQRIEEAGGSVTIRNGTARRERRQFHARDRRASSFSTAVRGDFLSNEPFTSRRTLHSERQYVLVIVSDGVSDRTDDAILMQHVMKLAMRGIGADQIAQEVAYKSSRHPHSDNASCIVALLEGQS
ncbi:hypothetical protein N7468_004072 [Penicillium chermesinum]|uniref:protein-serine/threonine phosphatase n=1 Tax=Penicillium chermesinum TaxID=63820 RepID=A0A9W9TSU8_9EURO|nr:uncharacterized protein N7468_004072 [Penicillium chermesinum]KAJ5239453.1 hypothetical protein N7468_004072 [Penicillium chermesinum]